MWNWLLNLFRTKKQFPPAQYLTTAEIASNIPQKDYKTLGKWLVKNITWDSDKDQVDDFKPTALTLDEGHGDCEDFAMVAQEVLAIWGVQDNYILGVMSTSSGHAVSIFRDFPGDTWKMYTNGEYKVGPVSFKDVPAWVAKDTGYKKVVYWNLYTTLNGSVNQFSVVDTDGERKNLIERLG